MSGTWIITNILKPYKGIASCFFKVWKLLTPLTIYCLWIHPKKSKVGGERPETHHCQAVQQRFIILSSKLHCLERTYFSFSDFLCSRLHVWDIKWTALSQHLITKINNKSNHGQQVTEKLTFCCCHSLIWYGSSNKPFLMNQNRSIFISWLVQNRQNYLIVCAAWSPPQTALHRSSPHHGGKDAPGKHQYELCCNSETLKATANTLDTDLSKYSKELCYCSFPKCSLNSYPSPKCTYMANIRSCSWNF